MPSVDKVEKALLERSPNPVQKANTFIFSQSFSACGNYLAVCDNHGYVSVYRLLSALAPNPKKECYKPFYRFQASDYTIYTLATHEGSLICGGNKTLTSWSWSSIIDKSARMIWSAKIPSDGNGLAESNSLDICAESDRLYAGCGDGFVHCWDLYTGAYQSKFSGHTNVIQSIKLQDSLIYSASEDGTVRIWDQRSSKSEAQHVITPSQDGSIARPSIGKWLACVTAQDDMVACGGGPKLSLWSTRTLSPLISMDTGANTQHTVLFTDDLLLSGGTGQKIYQWYINGECKTTVPATPFTLYNISINSNNSERKMLTACGTGYKVDVCLNYGYRSFSYEI